MTFGLQETQLSLTNRATRL